MRNFLPVIGGWRGRRFRSPIDDVTIALPERSMPPALASTVSGFTFVSIASSVSGESESAMSGAAELGSHPSTRSARMPSSMGVIHDARACAISVATPKVVS